MLDPDLVLSTIVSAFRSIPSVVAQLAGDPLNIQGHDYSVGTENSLARAIGMMPAPSILVTYLDLLGGNFSGATVWKHRLEVYIRPKNAAMGGVGSPSGPPASSPMHLWWLMMNSPILAGPTNFRNTALLNGSLMLVDTPTLTHRIDELAQDFFVGSLVFPENGDD